MHAANCAKAQKVRFIDPGSAHRKNFGRRLVNSATDVSIKHPQASVLSGPSPGCHWGRLAAAHAARAVVSRCLDSMFSFVKL